MSFTDLRSTDVRHPLNVNGVGLANYQRLLHDDAMRKAAWNTFFFVATGVPLTVVFGLAAAVALHGGIGRAKTFFRFGLLPAAGHEHHRHRGRLAVPARPAVGTAERGAQAGRRARPGLAGRRAHRAAVAGGDGHLARASASTW